MIRIRVNLDNINKKTWIINKYNNFQVDLIGIDTFDGIGESAWHFINSIKVIARARRWPTGETGADILIGAYGTYGEVI